MFAYLQSSRRVAPWGLLSSDSIVAGSKHATIIYLGEGWRGVYRFRPKLRPNTLENCEKYKALRGDDKFPLIRYSNMRSPLTDAVAILT